MRIRHSAALNLAGLLLPLLLALLTVPLYLEALGTARFGVLSIFWLLLGYFGLFDFGLSRATAQAIAASRRQSAAVRARLFHTALVLNLALGTVGGLLIYPVASLFFGHVLQIDSPLRAEVLSVVGWLIVAVPLLTLEAVMTGSLQGRERFVTLNAFHVASASLLQLLPLAAALWLDNRLETLVPLAVLARLMAVWVLARVTFRDLLQGQSRLFCRQDAARLIGFGSWVTVTSVIGPLMVVLDRFVMGAMTGAQAVAHYVVAFQLAQRSVMPATSLGQALFPRLAPGHAGEAHGLGARAIYVLLLVQTPLVVLGMLLLTPFLQWWLGQEFAASAGPAALVLLLGFWVNGIARVPFTLLQARGRPDQVAKCHLVELFPYLIVLFVLIDGYGAVGAAVAFALRVLADFVLLAALAGLLKDAVRKAMVPVALLLAAMAVSGSLNTWAEALLACGLFLPFLAIWMLGGGRFADLASRMQKMSAHRLAARRQGSGMPS